MDMAIEINTKQKRTYYPTFTLQEIKQTILDNIDRAQDVSSDFYLSKMTTYKIHQVPLERYFEKHKKSKPSKMDCFSYTILLSYHKSFIENVSDFSEIKLFDIVNQKNENTDFIFKDAICAKDIKEEFEIYDCICSYKRLQNIFIITNKNTNIDLQLGSECITKFKLLSNSELKKFKQAEQSLKERNREINEGKPMGYIQNEKNNKNKIKQIETDRKKEEERQRKREKEREKYMKKTEKDMKKMQQLIRQGKFAKCIPCYIDEYKAQNVVDVRKKHDTVRVCNKCTTNYYLYDEHIHKQKSLKHLLCIDIINKSHSNTFKKCENCSRGDYINKNISNIMKINIILYIL
jgi:hypothetical protein